MRTFKLVLAALLFSGTALAAPPADLDATVAKALQQFDVPGAAIAIVEDGKPVLTKGYGVRGLDDKRPADAQTLFDIGSCSKAFTAALVEALVDDGKISLDDKVIDRVPAFRLADAYAASNATVRDALTHRTGLGSSQGDLLWIATDMPRTELLRRVRFMTAPNTFREKFAYSNLAYAAAGEAAGNAAGTSYEAALRARIFKPLGIDGAAIDGKEYDQAANKALEHARLSDGFDAGKISPIKRTRLDAIAPAGSLALSAEHLAKWIGVQLADGALPDGKRLWSEARAKEMREIVTPVPPTLAGSLAGAKPSFAGYALGWIVMDVNGHAVVTHTGGTLGASSQVVYIPDLKLGFAVATSVGEGSMTRAITLTLLDHYLKRDPSDRVAEIKKQSDAAIAQHLEQVKKVQGLRDANAKLPVDADKLAGTWKSPWLGEAAVTHDKDALSFKLSGNADLAAKLEPWRGDTFLARWSDRRLGESLVTFVRKASDGSAERITIGGLTGGAAFVSGAEFTR